MLLTGLALAGCAFIAPAAAQQTLFNVPSADVLPAGKLYLEEDNFWRPGRLEDTYVTLRAVAGLGSAIEAGVNVGGLAAQGRSAPAAILAVKWQPVHASRWAVTTGISGQFFLRGSREGSPSAHAYAHAAWTPGEKTRFTGGVWYATSGYADAGVTKGVLGGIEQRLSSTLLFQADWYSGRNGLGTFTPGFSWTIEQWVVYAGYSVKNGDSNGNAVLVELGRYW
ncbi:MAG: hypothetical protein EPN53_10125 [Acidobacteria bacterium]|nr:MAG: hypothetical protein EPN53_10125 [Acidobacteriota bacterium]